MDGTAPLRRAEDLLDLRRPTHGPRGRRVYPVPLQFRLVTRAGSKPLHLVAVALVAVDHLFISTGLSSFPVSSFDILGSDDRAIQVDLNIIYDAC